MIVFTANGRYAKIKADEPITTGSVGMPVSVVLSGDFDGLAATMVFACGDVSADVALMGQDVTVPPQVLEEAGRMLEIGVYGARADGTIVIPTVWAKADIVHEGVLPSGVDPAEPTPSWAAQVQQWAEDAHDTAEDAHDTAEQLAQDVASWEAEIDTAIEDARDATQDATQTAASIAQAETARVTAEQARVTAESSRAAAETARVTAEASRATAESSRAAAESSRVTAEQARVTAESSRAAAETGRSTAESARDEAEQARVTAESARATAEQGRAAAESSRAEAEQSRVTAESARVTTESARATAETTRDTAEQSRAAAETARASAESVRVTAEQGRASAENARASAESARVTAESARASAETSRATAETARATAETARATEWAEIEPAAQAATQSATVAATLATRAADAATAVVAAAANGNVPYGTLTGEVVSASDAWSAFAKSVGVHGKSTQAGTPTPDAPVPILSVDDLTLNVCGKNLFDPSHILEASGWTVSDGIYTGMINELFNKYGPNASGYPIFGLSSEAQSYTISLDYTPSDATKDTFIRFKYTDGTAEAHAITLRAAGHYTGTTNPNKILTEISFSYSSTQSISLSNIQLELGSTETGYEPYVGQSVPVPLSNHIARSLPDGTEDSLTLTYQGPSETEGWGVFSKVLTQNVGVATINASEWQNENAVLIGDGWYRTVKDALRGAESVAGATATQGMCTAAPFVYNASLKSEHVGTQGVYMLLVAQESTAAAIAAKYDGATVLYKLATPVTYDLGTVELPVNPAPDLTAWADGGSAQPTMSMEYERALSIVIPRIEAAISDLATS